MMRRVLTAVSLGIAAAWLGTPAAAAEVSCAELGGVSEAEQLCRIQATTEGYRLNLVFPTDYAEQDTLTDYVVQNRDGFVSVAQMPGPRAVPYEMDGSTERYRSGQPPGGTESVVLKIYQDIGGPHPSTWYKTFTYDLARHRPLTFDTLFGPDERSSDVLETIFPLVQRDLERQLGWRAAVLPGTGTDPAHYQNFAITDDELIFFFAPGELLPLASGATSARVARSAIPPLALG